MTMRRIIAGFGLAVGLAWGAAAQVLAPITPPPQPGIEGRKFIDSMPSYMTANDGGAAGTARRRGVMIRMLDASDDLELQPTFFIEATVSCTSGSGTVTLTPGVIPDVAIFSVGTTYQIKIPGCGAASGILTGNLTSISAAGASQTIVLNGATAGTTFNGVATLALGPQGGLNTTIDSANRTTPNAARYFSSAAISFTAGSRTLTVPSGMFAAHDYSEVGPGAFYYTEISIPNARGAACNLPLATVITALPTATTATLRDAPTCTVAGGSGWLHWGPIVFSPDDVGRSIELLNGTSIGNLVTTISAYVDPLHVVLAANNTGGAKASKAMAELTVGPNDTTRFFAATATAVAAGQRYFYIPPDKAYFLPTATAADFETGAAVVWCGPGEVYLPRSLKIGKAVARNCINPPPTPWPGNTIDPGKHLRTSRGAIGTIKVAVLGDSQGTAIYNDLSRTGFPDVLCAAIRADNPGRAVDCTNNFAIGGTNWAAFDPTGPDQGFGVGIPNVSPASLPTWYTPTSNQYYTFVQAACPHVLVVKWGFNDGYNFLPSAMKSFFDTTQGTTWRTACGFNPDVILVTEGGPGQAVPGGYTTPDARRYTADFLRSVSVTCAFVLANGGCPGLIDMARARELANYGFSTMDLIPERADYVYPTAQPNGGPTITTTSYTWPAPTMDYGITITSARRTAADAAAWWSGQTVTFTLGAGASGTPASTAGVDGLDLPMTGGALTLGYSGGNYTVKVSAFDVTSTVTATGSGTTVTCATACVNMAYKGFSIDIPGAGTAGATHTTTITAINQAGTVITLADAIITNFTSVSKAFRFYWDIVPTFNTGVLARCSVVTTFCDSAFLFTRQGNMISLYDGTCFSCGPIFYAPAVIFGGYHTPTVTFAAITSWRLGNTSGTNVPRITHGRPENGTPYSPYLSDAEMWGRTPGGAGRWAGGNNVHPSTLEAAMQDRVLHDIGWSLDTGGQASAVSTPTTGFTYVVPPGQTLTVFTPAGTLATGTVTFAGSIAENQMVQIMSTQQITSLTVNPPSGLTMTGATATTLAANGTLTYRRAGTRLVRVQ